MSTTATRPPPPPTPPASRGRRSPRGRIRRPGTMLLWLLLVIGAIITVAPVYWIFVTAVSPPEQVNTPEFYLWPESLHWESFSTAFATQPILTWFINSTIITVGAVIVTVLTSLLGGYAFAKYHFPCRDLLFVLVLVTITVPIQVIMVPEFIIVNSLGMTDTPWAVILPRSAEALAIFMARQFMLSIPDEMINAARVDGAGELAIFWRIVLPMSGPLIAVLVILTFVWRWNEFIWPLIALPSISSYTLPVGLNSMNSIYNSATGSIMAVSLISIIPVLIVFLLFQRRFVQGMASSGLK